MKFAFYKFLSYKAFELIVIYLKYPIVEKNSSNDATYLVFHSLLFLNYYLLLCSNCLCRASSDFVRGIFLIRIGITLWGRQRPASGLSNSPLELC